MNIVNIKSRIPDLKECKEKYRSMSFKVVVKLIRDAHIALTIIVYSYLSESFFYMFSFLGFEILGLKLLEWYGGKFNNIPLKFFFGAVNNLSVLFCVLLYGNSSDCQVFLYSNFVGAILFYPENFLFVLIISVTSAVSFVSLELVGPVIGFQSYGVESNKQNKVRTIMRSITAVNISLYTLFFLLVYVRRELRHFNYLREALHEWKLRQEDLIRSLTHICRTSLNGITPNVQEILNGTYLQKNKFIKHSKFQFVPPLLQKVDILEGILYNTKLVNNKIQKLVSFYRIQNGELDLERAPTDVQDFANNLVFQLRVLFQTQQKRFLSFQTFFDKNAPKYAKLPTIVIRTIARNLVFDCLSQSRGMNVDVDVFTNGNDLVFRIICGSFGELQQIWMKNLPNYDCFVEISMLSPEEQKAKLDRLREMKGVPVCIDMMITMKYSMMIGGRLHIFHTTGEKFEHYKTVVELLIPINDEESAISENESLALSHRIREKDNEQKLLSYTTPLTILIVDDSPTNLEIAARMCERVLDERCEKSDQYVRSASKILLASGGEEALALLDMNQGGCDVALLDLRMEPINGIELAKKIKGRKDCNNTQIFLVTADLINIKNFEGIEFFNGGVEKPINRGHILKIIDKVYYSKSSHSFTVTDYQKYMTFFSENDDDYYHSTPVVQFGEEHDYLDSVSEESEDEEKKENVDDNNIEEEEEDIKEEEEEYIHIGANGNEEFFNFENEHSDDDKDEVKEEEEERVMNEADILFPEFESVDLPVVGQEYDDSDVMYKDIASTTDFEDDEEEEEEGEENEGGQFGGIFLYGREEERKRRRISKRGRRFSKATEWYFDQFEFFEKNKEKFSFLSEPMKKKKKKKVPLRKKKRRMEKMKKSKRQWEEVMKLKKRNNITINPIVGKIPVLDNRLSKFLLDIRVDIFGNKVEDLTRPIDIVRTSFFYKTGHQAFDVVLYGFIMLTCLYQIHFFIPIAIFMIQYNWMVDYATEKVKKSLEPYFLRRKSLLVAHVEMISSIFKILSLEVILGSKFYMTRFKLFVLAPLSILIFSHYIHHVTYLIIITLLCVALEWCNFNGILTPLFLRLIGSDVPVESLSPFMRLDRLVTVYQGGTVNPLLIEYIRFTQRFNILYKAILFVPFYLLIERVRKLFQKGNERNLIMINRLYELKMFQELFISRLSKDLKIPLRQISNYVTHLQDWFIYFNEFKKDVALIDKKMKSNQIPVHQVLEHVRRAAMSRFQNTFNRSSKQRMDVDDSLEDKELVNMLKSMRKCSSDLMLVNSNFAFLYDMINFPLKYTINYSYYKRHIINVTKLVKKIGKREVAIRCTPSYNTVLGGVVVDSSVDEKKKIAEDDRERKKVDFRVVNFMDSYRSRGDIFVSGLPEEDLEIMIFNLVTTSLNNILYPTEKRVGDEDNEFVDFGEDEKDEDDEFKTRKKKEKLNEMEKIKKRTGRDCIEVQIDLRGPLDSEWKKELEKQGIDHLSRIPKNRRRVLNIIIRDTAKTWVYTRTEIPLGEDLIRRKGEKLVENDLNNSMSVGMSVTRRIVSCLRGSIRKMDKPNEVVIGLPCCNAR